MDFEAILRRFDAARNGRANWDDIFQQIADRVLPQASDFTTKRTDGERRTELMFDATAALAAQKAVAAISSFIWPSNQRYQKLTTSNKALNNNQRVKVYLDALTETLFTARYSPKAAFESQMGESALQYFVFGTGLMFVDDDIKARQLRYKSLHLGNTWLLEGPNGVVDTVFRCWKWSLRQVNAKWPGMMPQSLMDKLAKNPEEQIEVAHCVMPRTDYDPGMPNYKGMPWASCYFLPGHKHQLDEGGYRSWPFGIMRCTTSPGEVYGRSPAWLALSNIKVLNAQKRTLLAAAQKVVDPPLLLPEDGALQAFSMQPGALNYGGVNDQGQQLVHPLVTNASIDIGLDMMDKEREIISSSFLMDVFRVLVEHPQMTATQTLELMQERAMLLSPLGGRLESEALGPITEREIQILADAGRIPPMPEELIEAEGEYKIEYTSPMRQAMRASEGIAITRTLEALLPMAEVDPEVFEPYNLVEMGKVLGEVNGVPAKCLRDAEEIAARAEQRAEQQEMAAMVEAAPAVSAAAANLTKMQANAGRPTL
jgi:hypothetical protein